MDKIVITVASGSGVGKSAIAQALHEFLKDHDFNTSYVNDEHPLRSLDKLHTYLDIMRSKIEIEINEAQLHRESK